MSWSYRGLGIAARNKIKNAMKTPDFRANQTTGEPSQQAKHNIASQPQAQGNRARTTEYGFVELSEWAEQAAGKANHVDRIDLRQSFVIDAMPSVGASAIGSLRVRGGAQSSSPFRLHLSWCAFALIAALRAADTAPT